MNLLPLLVAATVVWSGPPRSPDSLDLNAALRLARERSPALRATDAQIHRAASELDAARAERGPRLSADLLYLRYQNPPQVALGAPPAFGPLLEDNFAVGLRVGQPIYTGGRVEAAVEAAEAGRSAAVLRARDVAAELDAAVTRAFDDILLARALVEVADEGVAVLEEALRVAREQLATGAVARIDVLRARTRLSSARAELRTARDGVADARERLAALLGLEEGSLPRIVGELTTVDPASVEEVRATVERVRERPALRALGDAAGAREEEARLARGSRFPVVSLELGVLSTRPEFGTGREEWGEELFAGVGVSWTFFDFGRSSSRGAASVAAADRLRALRAAMEDSLRAVSRVEARRLERALREVEDARANVGRAEDVLDLAEERYREGIGIQLEVLEAQADLARVRAELYRAVHSSRVAAAELRRAAGRPAMAYPIDPSEGGVP